MFFPLWADYEPFTWKVRKSPECVRNQQSRQKNGHIADKKPVGRKRIKLNGAVCTAQIAVNQGDFIEHTVIEYEAHVGKNHDVVLSAGLDFLGILNNGRCIQEKDKNAG